MISVLIPVYNFEVTTLVDQLVTQCSHTSEEYEILCIDDGSENSFREKNAAIAALPGVRYEELSRNIGRAKIRELLAEKARYKKVLFLDCDVVPKDDDFISRYLGVLDREVVIGGLTYDENPPTDKALMLRWKYGREREERSAKERSEGTHLQFLASNLLIDKQLFSSINQLPELKGYGHEDTWLGLELQKKKIDVLHIDNPVIHLGLDQAADFLLKSRSGVENLVQLYLNKPEAAQLRLVAAFNRLKKWRLLRSAHFILKLRLNSIEKNLLGNQPNIGLFDQWKLYHFLECYLKLSSTTRS